MDSKDVGDTNLETVSQANDQEPILKNKESLLSNKSSSIANQFPELKHQQSQSAFLNPRQQSVYQKRVNYIPNTNFSGNKSSLLIQDDVKSPQASIPNTFHYKSHPNAKSKDLGVSAVAEEDHSSSARQNSQLSGITPQWMPEELNVKWTPQPVANDAVNTHTLSQKIRSMDFQPSSTVIHNSDVQMSENLPWKSELESPAAKNLRGIFQNSKELSNKEETTSSVTSTPVGTRISSTRHPIAFNLNELNPPSPLKLYNDNYNTFTRNKLEGVLQNIASNRNTPAQPSNRQISKGVALQKPPLIENLQTSNIPLRSSIKDFTKTKSYTASAYKANAENIFSRLIKKGPKGNIDRMRSVSKETATSTPKRNPVYTQDNQNTHYSSFSTSYTSEDKSIPADNHNLPKQVSNEFTSITNDSKSKSEIETDGLGSDVTFDSPSELADELGEVQESLYTQDLTNSRTSGSGKLDLSQSLESNNQLSKSKSLSVDDEDTIGVIKFKSKSKLRGKGITPLVNGKVEPNLSLSQEYPGMIYDPANLKWISTDEQNKTLDNIEDLTDDEVELTGILKKANSRSRRNNFEVSFQDPDSLNERVDYHESGFAAGDVTKLSQLGETSFSESKRRLVSILTNVLELQMEISDWDEVEDIDLSNCELSSLVDLYHFLPKLKKLSAANNHIKYLAGLPKSIHELDLSENEVEDRSTFSDLKDLHCLILEHNLLTETTNLSKNINLTVLKLSHNNIDDISGLKSLSNLFYLDLSFNKLTKLDMKGFELPNLQELNVSNNLIERIENIDHLYSLRILNCDKNQMTKVNFTSTSLRKLLLNQNNLEYVDLKGLRKLFCVRFDGNIISQLEFPVCNLIELVSMKSQPYMRQIWENSAPQCDHLSRLDFSGNRWVPNNVFPFISDLNLSAMNLSQLPTDFANLFPNVQYLNLNFNKLESIEPLSQLQGLKKLWLVSNRISNYYLTCKHLQNCNKKLVLLDQRLNSFNISFYDFIFDTDEANIDIELATVEDIEVFANRLEELDRTHEWEERDDIFQHELEKRRDLNLIKGREEYQSVMMLFFKHLKSLDGIPVTNACRQLAHALYRKLHPKGK